MKKVETVGELLIALEAQQKIVTETGEQVLPETIYAGVHDAGQNAEDSNILFCMELVEEGLYIAEV